MHALRHVQELLAPDGLLVDLHPIAETTVEIGGKTAGTISEPDWLHGLLPNAEAGLAEVVRLGWFAPEAETELDVLSEFDAAADLLEERTELEEQPELAERLRAAGGPIRTRDRVILRVLRAQRR